MIRYLLYLVLVKIITANTFLILAIYKINFSLRSKSIAS